MSAKYIDQFTPKVYDVAEVSTASVGEARDNNDVQVTYEYLNYMHHPVTIVSRDNVRLTIPPRQPKANESGLVVRRVYSYTSRVSVNTYGVLCDDAPKQTTVFEAFSRINTQTTFASRRKEAMTIYRIPLSDIDAEGCLYVDDIDILVTTINVNSDLFPDHPHSPSGRRNRRLIDDGAANELDRFSYTLYIVDRARRFGERYVNINNRVFRVPVCRYSDEPDGVYLVSTGEASTGGVNKPISRRYALSDADSELGLYQSIHEAQSLGDLERQYKEREREHNEEIQQLKRDTEQLKTQAQHEKVHYERERETLDTERKSFEHDMERRKREMQHWEDEVKHRYNLREMDRKDQSGERKDMNDMIKVLPAIFTGLMALFVALRK